MLNIYYQVQFLIDDDDPKPNSVSLLKETNFTLKCDMFPCIKIGDAPLIQLYGESVTAPNLDPELKNLEEFKKVNKKILESLPSLGSTLVKSVPPFIREEKQEEKFVKEPLSKTTAPWEGVLDQSVKCLPETSSRAKKKLEDSGFPTVSFFLLFFSKF